MTSASAKKTGLLFDLGAPKPVQPSMVRIRHPIWTENKARLIELYLRYFVFVTHNGAYIDGFAGPQEETDGSGLWSARLVLQSQPKWLRQFFLRDANLAQVTRLQALRDAELPLRPQNNRIEVMQGDFNQRVAELLATRPIRDAEAAFCLLDQRTFECHWATVEQIARYKPAGQHKIELFYFYPQGWVARSLAALRNEQVLRNWWGRDDIDALKNASAPNARRDMFVDRLRNELGYTYVMPWPIYDRQEAGGRVMYYMIHASDHPEAPKLMGRAYRKAVDPAEPVEQLTLELDELLAKE